MTKSEAFTSILGANLSVLLSGLAYNITTFIDCRAGKWKGCYFSHRLERLHPIHTHSQSFVYVYAGLYIWYEFIDGQSSAGIMRKALCGYSWSCADLSLRFIYTEQHKSQHFLLHTPCVCDWGWESNVLRCCIPAYVNASHAAAHRLKRDRGRCSYQTQITRHNPREQHADVWPRRKTCKGIFAHFLLFNYCKIGF